jgi:hypothetical protein
MEYQAQFSQVFVRIQHIFKKHKCLSPRWNVDICSREQVPPFRLGSLSDLALNYNLLLHTKQTIWK